MGWVGSCVTLYFRFSPYLGSSLVLVIFASYTLFYHLNPSMRLIGKMDWGHLGLNRGWSSFNPQVHMCGKGGLLILWQVRCTPSSRLSDLLVLCVHCILFVLYPLQHASSSLPPSLLLLSRRHPSALSTQLLNIRRQLDARTFTSTHFRPMRSEETRWFLLSHPFASFYIYLYTRTASPFHQ